MSIFVDIHALQTLPPSNINRDDTGAPKSAIFGGVPRQRVSSQAWKSAIRQDFVCKFDSEKLGLRTKQIGERVIKKIEAIDPTFDLQQAEKSVVDSFKSLGKKGIKLAPKEDGAVASASYLLFFSNLQLTRLAHEIVNAGGKKLTKKQLDEILNKNHSVDIALFGRMLADAPDFNVDASCQVAHAIGVHESEPEFDYFTAVDDAVRDADESGAGMIGTVEMMSSTLYRYANISLDGLLKNLGDKDATVEATSQFVRSFITAMPTGKQNTFANRTLPDAVVVTLREDRPISYVNAFEEPISESAAHGRRYEAAKALAQEAKSIEETYGFEPAKSYVLAVGDLKEALSGTGENLNLKDLLAALENDVREALVD